MPKFLEMHPFCTRGCRFLHPRVQIHTFPDILATEPPSAGRVRTMLETGAHYGEHWMDPNVDFLARRY